MYTSLSLGQNGRLGNQLFQYAALKSLAVRNAMPAYLPPPSQDPNDSGFTMHRMNLFKSRVIYAPKELLANNIANQYNEKQFNFDPEFFNLPPKTNIHGYFQSEKYFKDVEYLIRKELDFVDQIKRLTDDIFSKLNLDKNKQITSIHVRRSDYLKLENHHPVCSKEYYLEAKKKFPNSTFILFSDDIPWCSENLKNDDTIIINTGKDYIDLSMMTRCDNNIICNSSFSWWGAWLNSNKNKVVVAPEKWFGPAYTNHNTQDLIPEGWLRK